MGVAIDTNVLVRYFTKDNEPLSSKAEEILTSAKSNTLALDRLIIAELGYVLKSVYGLKKDQVVMVYKALLSNEIFNILDRELVELAIQLFDEEKPLSFENSWLLAMKRSGKVSDVLTFDDALSKRQRL
ncbi:MAG: PIN domain-containing protein [Candidatus Saccharimonadales bacterium]